MARALEIQTLKQHTYSHCNQAFICDICDQKFTDPHYLTFIVDQVTSDWNYSMIEYLAQYLEHLCTSQLENITFYNLKINWWEQLTDSYHQSGWGDQRSGELVPYVRVWQSVWWRWSLQLCEVVHKFGFNPSICMVWWKH